MVLRGGGDSPSAVSAAALATLLRESMFDAPELALSEAERHVAALPEGSLVAGALRRVRELRDGCRAGNATHRDAVAELGGFGEVVGALAIGVFAALTSSSWQEALSLATDWDGDVAGAGAICGFVKGVQEGPGRIGEDLVGSLDVGEQVLRLGLDAAEEFGSMPANSPEWFARYPVLPKHRTTGAGAPREGGQTAGRTTRGTEQSTVGTSDVNMNAVERAIADFAAEEAPVSRVYEEFLRTPMLLVTSPESSDPVFFHIKDQEKEQIWVCTRAEAVPDFAPGTRVAIGYQLLPLLGGRNVHIATPGDQNDLMLIGERAVLHSLPELTDEFREEARRHPGSWLPVPDVMFRSSPGAELGEHAFVGQFWVDESGELSGDYRPNPTYMPSPVTLGFPEPASPLERALHLKYTGYASESELASVVARTEFALVVDEDGSVPTTTSSGEDRPVAIAASAAKYVPDIGKNAVRVRAESLRSLLQEVDLVFDAGTAHQVRLPGAALIDALDAGPESEGAEPAREAQPQQAGAPSPQPQPQPQPPRPEPNAHERFLGSMLAGAMGDALGYAIEFNDIEMIRRHHGPAGVTGPVLRDGLAHISDDTQMMLFTLEGLIRAHVARRIKPVDSDPVPEVQHAYQRWYHTQNQPWERAAGPYARHLAQPDGWLITNRELFSPRAPGNTCMSALANFAQTHQHATPRHRINDSKGCGGVMRAAPVAVWSNDPAEVFKAAVDTAALTHSHPSGFLSAGVLAVVVHQLIRSVPLADSVRVARDLLVRWPEHEEQLRALDAAVDLGARGPVSPEELKQTLGEGWVGEEALAIGLYAVMATGDLPSALLLSVNHSGDSDSTGIVCGNIAGAIYGNQAIPPEWLEKLELHDVIHTLARDALAEFSPGPPTDPAWSRRYPAW
ncbi:hypothetical protein N599_12935 [Saccharopolyspora erythraea D]|nr:hypothetical protein N599_12935 [Saccharopolyspora erythraea D]